MMSYIKQLAEMDQTEIRELTRKYVLLPWAAQTGGLPLAIKRAEGCYFWDADNKKYLDFWSQGTVVNAGFNNKTIIDAIKAQLDINAYVTESATTGVKAEYCKLIAELTPKNLIKTFMVPSGADAVENSIKIARTYTKKLKIMARYRSYHGATYGVFRLLEIRGGHRLNQEFLVSFEHFSPIVIGVLLVTNIPTVILNAPKTSEK